MELTVSIEEKLEFLNRFIDQHANSRIIWFFEDLIQNNHKLNRIYFVEKLKSNQTGLFIVINEKQQIFYYFKKGRVKLKDIHTAFHELNMNKETPFYICMKFQNENMLQMWQQVIEVSDFYKMQLEIETNNFLTHITYQNQKSWIEKQIDRALETKDKALFNKLVEIYHEIIFEESNE